MFIYVFVCGSLTFRIYKHLCCVYTRRAHTHTQKCIKLWCYLFFSFFLSSQVAGLRTKDASTGTESTTSPTEERPAARPLRENRASSDRQSSRRSTLTLRRLHLIAAAPAVIPMARALYGNKLASPNVPKLAEEVNTYIITTTAQLRSIYYVDIPFFCDRENGVSYFFYYAY